MASTESLVIESKLNFQSDVTAVPAIGGRSLTWFIFRPNGQEVKVKISACHKYIIYASSKLTQAEIQYIKDQYRDEEYYK